jgi:heptosyltransferase I
VTGNERLLIVKMSSIGDVVQALPVAAALRRKYPEAFLAWAVQPAAQEALTGNPHLNEVLVVGGEQALTGARAVPPLSSPLKLRKALHSFHFDLALDLQGLLKSAAVAYLSGAKKRLGYDSFHEGTRLCYTQLIPKRTDIHAVDSYLDFAAALDAPREPVAFTLVASDEDRRRVDELLTGPGRWAAIIPGARWESKLWPAERFAAVATALQQAFGLTSVIIGAAGDAALAARIMSATPAPLLDLTGKTTLKQAAEVFRRCVVTIGNDTGPLYLSSAVGTPTVAVFGPTDARRLGPYGPGHAKVVAQVDCTPCRNRQCQHLRCMESITPEQVMMAVRRLLGSREAG